MLPELAAAVAQAPQDTLYLVISEGTQRPYSFYNFSHLAAAVIKAAGIEGRTFPDLRRNAVVRLALAGCTIPEIAAITGHSYQRCTEILETYLPRTTEAARNAIVKLLEHRERRAAKGEHA